MRSQVLVMMEEEVEGSTILALAARSKGSDTNSPDELVTQISGFWNASTAGRLM